MPVAAVDKRMDMDMDMGMGTDTVRNQVEEAQVQVLPPPLVPALLVPALLVPPEPVHSDLQSEARVRRAQFAMRRSRLLPPPARSQHVPIP